MEKCFCPGWEPTFTTFQLIDPNVQSSIPRTVTALTLMMTIMVVHQITGQTHSCLNQVRVQELHLMLTQLPVKLLVTIQAMMTIIAKLLLSGRMFWMRMSARGSFQTLLATWSMLHHSFKSDKSRTLQKFIPILVNNWGKLWKPLQRATFKNFCKPFLPWRQYQRWIDSY